MVKVLEAPEEPGTDRVRQGAREAFMTRPCGCAKDILPRIRGEYREMPGLQVSLTQACRLWGLEASSCEANLKALVDEGFLACNRGGASARLDPGSPRRAISPRGRLRAATHGTSD